MTFLTISEDAGYTALYCLQNNAEAHGSLGKEWHEPHGFHKTNKRMIAHAFPCQCTSMAMPTRPFLQRSI